MNVAALYCRKTSVYRSIPGVDVFDEERDAFTFNGGVPVVAHPPCGPWGKYRKVCYDINSESHCGFHAVHMVRRWGGVLEHPSTSQLFKVCDIDVRTGRTDEYGGYCIVVPQRWFGHRAEKLSALYIVGVSPGDLPQIPLTFDLPITTVERMCKAERERTPLQLATWLVDVARMSA